MYHTQQSISAVYFLSAKIKNSPVISHYMCLFFKQSNFRPKQGGGDSEKMLSKLPNKKSKQTLARLKGRVF